MSDWSITYNNDDLIHYGILGMKWGVRRYQNPDGTLTPAGQKRYYKTVQSLYNKKPGKIKLRKFDGLDYKIYSSKRGLKVRKFTKEERDFYKNDLLKKDYDELINTYKNTPEFGYDRTHGQDGYLSTEKALTSSKYILKEYEKELEYSKKLKKIVKKVLGDIGDKPLKIVTNKGKDYTTILENTENRLCIDKWDIEGIKMNIRYEKERIKRLENDLKNGVKEQVYHI